MYPDIAKAAKFPDAYEQSALPVLRATRAPARTARSRGGTEPTNQIKHSRPERFFGTIRFRGLDRAANRFDRKPT
jgi:hypothetical protein